MHSKWGERTKHTFEQGREVVKRAATTASRFVTHSRDRIEELVAGEEESGLPLHEESKHTSRDEAPSQSSTARNTNSTQSTHADADALSPGPWSGLESGNYQTPELNVAGARQ